MKVALVTGAAAGIGTACSRRLAQEGIAVGVLDLDEARCADTVAAIDSDGGKAVALGADVSTATRYKAAVAKLRDAFGPITIVVNNAGVTDFTPFEQVTEELFELRLPGQRARPDHRDAGDPGRYEGGAVGPDREHLVLQRADRLQEHGGLFLFQGRGHQPDPDAGPGTRPARHHGQHDPPGSVMGTVMSEANVRPENVERLAATLPVRRVGRPEDIANACAFLVRRGVGLYNRSDHRREWWPGLHLSRASCSTV